MNGPWWFQFQWIGAPFVMASVAAIYYITNQRADHREKLLGAAHGITGVLLYFGAFLVAWLDPRGYRPSLSIPYAVLYLIPLGFIVLAFWRFRGHWVVHTLQIPNIMAMLWAGFVGSMAVTGDWL